jgi:hypothetical protein
VKVDESENVVSRFEAREVDEDSEVVCLVTGRKCGRAKSLTIYSAICCSRNFSGYFFVVVRSLKVNSDHNQGVVKSNSSQRQCVNTEPLTQFESTMRRGILLESWGICIFLKVVSFVSEAVSSSVNSVTRLRRANLEN